MRDLQHFFGHDYGLFPFQIFSLSHFIMLFFFFFGSILIVMLQTTLKKYEKVIKTILFVCLFLFETLYHVWLFVGGQWSIAFALPFHLCSISLLLCLILLLSNSKLVFQFVYFLGFAGAMQAMVTPELFVGFPHFRFFQFFTTHMLIIWVGLFFVFVKGYVVTKRGLWQSFAFLNAAAVIAFLANIATGGNYMFLAHKPENPSLIDFLGPYPLYILVLECIALVLFFVLYLPWRKRGERK
ncbi:TIGR02206 family membrane protein [Robertmurraya sp. FSL W8-0741]|uniref:YwaF family protein n=1 Tax=Robertmurraya sp. FSL W8-0741 TaxID=2954629 RepID=UPI0030FCF492